MSLLYRIAALLVVLAPLFALPADAQAPQQRRFALVIGNTEYKAGKLPTVDARLPKNPLVVPVIEKVGEYGGVWRRAFLGPADANNYVRVVYDESAALPSEQIVSALTREAEASGLETPSVLPGESLWEHFHHQGSGYWTEDNRPVTPVLQSPAAAATTRGPLPPPVDTTSPSGRAREGSSRPPSIRTAARAE